MRTLKMATITIEKLWKMVNYKISKIYNLDHFIKDNIFGDNHCGLFGILDGHGGFKVSRFCTDSIPDVSIPKIFNI